MIIKLLLLSLPLLAQIATGELLDITILGTIGSNEIQRGPFQNAAVDDAVTITFQIETDNNGASFPGFNNYIVSNYELNIAGTIMEATYQPTFFFTTFAFFNGFELTSTGSLLPSGQHNYKLPQFGASGPPTIWSGTGTEPDDHLGAQLASLFDTFNGNVVIDSGGGGAGIDHDLEIVFSAIIITTDY